MIRRSLAFLTTLGTVLLATATAFADDPPMIVRPIDISTEGHRSDWLFDVTAISVTVLFVLQALILIYAMVKFRAGKGGKGHYDHGTSRADARLIALISSVIFVVVDVTLLYFSFRDVNGVWWKWPTDPNTVQVEVVAQQWAWNFRYPGPDGKFNTADDIVTLNDLRVPVGRPVHLKMQSLDVIHSFYLPNFRTKQDTVPGSMSQLWFQAKQTGVVDIGCAQHCGSNHYKMHGVLTVLSAQDFDAWHKVAAADAIRKFDETDVAAHWGWAWEK